MRRSAFRSWAELALVALAACHAPEVRSAQAPLRTAPPGFAFSHDNSRTESWPFGLNSISTKFVAEPDRANAFAASYWVVRTQPGAEVPTEALVARVRLRPEFPGGSFVPVQGVDFELALEPDRNGATFRELKPGLLEVHMPADERARQRGFVLRARFGGDDTLREPPKALLAELESVTTASGRALPLGEPRLVRWLIVEAAQAPVAAPAARGD